MRSNNERVINIKKNALGLEVEYSNATDSKGFHKHNGDDRRYGRTQWDVDNIHLKIKNM